MLEIREATINDIEKLILIESEIFLDSSEKWNKEAINFAITDNLYKVFIIEDKNDFIGYAIMTISDFEVYIAKFGIFEKFRGNGYGEKLLKFIVENIKTEMIILEVRSKNIPAINLYKKVGFIEEGRREQMYQNPVDDALILIRKEESC